MSGWVQAQLVLATPPKTEPPPLTLLLLLLLLPPSPACLPTDDCDPLL
jgi:hypothetical protein